MKIMKRFFPPHFLAVPETVDVPDAVSGFSPPGQSIFCLYGSVDRPCDNVCHSMGKCYS